MSYKIFRATDNLLYKLCVIEKNIFLLSFFSHQLFYKMSKISLLNVSIDQSHPHPHPHPHLVNMAMSCLICGSRVHQTRVSFFLDVSVHHDTNCLYRIVQFLPESKKTKTKIPSKWTKKKQCIYTPPVSMATPPPHPPILEV